MVNEPRLLSKLLCLQILQGQSSLEASDEPELDFIALLSSVGDEIHLPETGPSGISPELVSPVLAAAFPVSAGFDPAQVQILTGDHLGSIYQNISLTFILLIIDLLTCS